MLDDPTSAEYRGVHDVDPVTAAIYALATGADLENLAGVVPELQKYLSSMGQSVSGLRNSTEQLPPDRQPPPPVSNDTSKLGPFDPFSAMPSQLRFGQNAMSSGGPAQQPPMQQPALLGANPTHLQGMHPPWIQPLPQQMGPPQPKETMPFWTSQPGISRFRHGPLAGQVGAAGPGIGHFAAEEQDAKQYALGPQRAPVRTSMPTRDVYGTRETNNAQYLRQQLEQGEQARAQKQQRSAIDAQFMSLFDL